MARFQSKYLGFKLLVKPMIKKIINNEVIVEQAEYIKFKQGIFVTEDEKQIKKLREIVKKNGAIWEIDEAKIKKARELAEEIEKLKAKYNEVDDSTVQVVENDMGNVERGAMRGTRTSDRETQANAQKVKAKEEKAEAKAEAEKPAPKKE